MLKPDDTGANIRLIGLAVGVATIGGFMFGYDSGVINGTQAGLAAAFGLGSAEQGLAVSALLLGCAVGAFSAGRLSDRLGRRRVMIFAAALFILGALTAGAAGSAAAFFCARFAGGLGVGAASVVTPAYISEVTPARLRGRFASLQQVMIISGLTGAFFANYWLAHLAGGSRATLWLGFASWRWMFWMQVAPALLYLATLLLVPESPRYLVSQGRDERADVVLTRLFGSAEAQRTLASIQASLAKDHRPRLADLRDARTGRWKPIVWVGVGLACLQQLVGINIVFYYGATLWQAVGFSESDALRINVLSGCLSIGGCLLALALIDRVGRKPLLAVGSAGMTVTLTAMALCFATARHGADGGLHLPAGIGLIALIAANAYTVLFNLSWGPVMWVLLGEMFPNQIRGSALAVSGAAQWLCNFLVSLSFPWLAANLGLPLTYAIYALSAALSLWFVAAAVRETRGVELEAMAGI